MSTRDDRWDWVEALRPQEVMEVLAREVAKHLADEIVAWPPRVQWTDAAQQARFASLFAPDAPAPSPAAIDLGFELARLELRHEHDAVAHAVRNSTLSPSDALAAQFLSRWMAEWLFDVNERTESRIARRYLVAALDDAQARVRADVASRGN